MLDWLIDQALWAAGELIAYQATGTQVGWGIVTSPLVANPNDAAWQQFQADQYMRRLYPDQYAAQRAADSAYVGSLFSSTPSLPPLYTMQADATKYTQ